MIIEQEIRSYLGSNLRELDTKFRDIELVIYFYGLKDNLWPTLEDAANKFDVGDSGGRRSERPRQIVNKKFKSVAKSSDFPSLVSFANHLKSDDFHKSSELISYVKSQELFDSEVNLISLLRMLHDLGECKEYKAYTIDLNELTRTSFDNKTDFFIVKKSSASILQKAFIKSKVIPGLLGIAKLDYLKEDPTTKQANFDTLVLLIQKSTDSWVSDYDGELYYLFESRANTLINNLGKTRNAAEFESLDTLKTLLHNSLKRRTPPKGFQYPPEEVISQYLLSSKFTESNDSVVRLSIEPEQLTEIEKVAVEFMVDQEVDDFPTISSHLKACGYSKPLVDKTVLYSPLIFVDKTKGRYHYKYKLAGSQIEQAKPNIDRYEIFRQRLLEASTEGTDGSSTVATRREQHILSEWLFKDKKQEECAICNKTFSVKSLITAHKKKRSDCAENERTDPRIVMPLCIFGCDYLYENRMLYIIGGKVISADNLGADYVSELNVIEKLVGNIINPKWLKGSSRYFPKPE
ncbi:hypothetical protein [Psychromonas sp. SR45-3]|uniref:hypothetical protein n=1 Tax=Psychromonas sp. SR45-3 TaxID=2760930 RepID=UPI0017ECCEE0|nr:hypothetical protein [Psychromonas sp. SR45-3]MBB1274571.1 hypothetical protein [Psychromonas sp. SR45-3]